MCTGPQPVDVTELRALRDLAEVVRRSGVGRLLKRGKEELALITPAGPRPSTAGLSRRRQSGNAGHDAILNIVGIGESAEPTDIARHERQYLAEAYAPEPR